MKGFEIEINEKKITTAVNVGTVLVIIDSLKPVLTITGRDQDLLIDWERIELKINDKIKITASEVVKTNTPPVSTKKRDRQELLTEYYRLKEMLTKEGLLK